MELKDFKAGQIYAYEIEPRTTFFLRHTHIVNTFYESNPRVWFTFVKNVNWNKTGSVGYVEGIKECLDLIRELTNEELENLILEQI